MLVYQYYITKICQELSSAASSMKLHDVFNFNVHAIDELKSRGVPTTNESPKYRYKCDDRPGLNAEYSYVMFFNFLR